MSGVSVTCWKCGAQQDDVLLPLSRTETCRACSADLHVCRMCRFYDTGVGNACREPVAENVADKTRANFCGYLELRQDPGTFTQEGSAAGEELNSLFGLDGSESGSGPGSLEDLFGDKPGQND